MVFNLAKSVEKETWTASIGVGKPQNRHPTQPRLVRLRQRAWARNHQKPLKIQIQWTQSKIQFTRIRTKWKDRLRLTSTISSPLHQYQTPKSWRYMGIPACCWIIRCDSVSRWSNLSNSSTWPVNTSSIRWKFRHSVFYGLDQRYRERHVRAFGFYWRPQLVTVTRGTIQGSSAINTVWSTSQRHGSDLSQAVFHQRKSSFSTFQAIYVLMMQ